jgi:hypothetical protein
MEKLSAGKFQGFASGILRLPPQITAYGHSSERAMSARRSIECDAAIGDKGHRATIANRALLSQSGHAFSLPVKTGTLFSY